MRKFLIGVGVMTVALSQGCTNLNAVRVSDGVMPAEGAPYNLTFTQYDVTVKHRLAACFNAKNEPDMQIVTTVEATRKESADPSREYVIDFAALRSFFKTTDVAIEYHDNGALKSVNATVQDKTGEFLKSTFSSAAKLALLGVGTAGLNAKACKEEIAALVKSRDGAQADVAQKTAALTRQSERLDRMVSVAAALGPTRSNAERQAMANEVKALYEAKANLDAVQQTLADAVKATTLITKMTWPRDGSTFSGQLAKPLTSQDIKQWGTVADKGLPKLASETGVWAMISSDSPSARHVVCQGTACTDAQDVQGLKYRRAMAGTFRACSTADCTGDGSVIFTDAGLFSQLGPVMTLPLRNWPFMTQTVVLTMNDAGQPTKVGYKSEGGADKAMDVVGTFVDELGKVRQARKPKTELDLITEETALLEAKAKLAVAKSTLVPNPNADQAAATAALNADTALLEAEIAKRKAQEVLDGLRKQGQS